MCAVDCTSWQHLTSFPQSAWTAAVSRSVRSSGMSTRSRATGRRRLIRAHSCIVNDGMCTCRGTDDVSLAGKGGSAPPWWRMAHFSHSSVLLLFKAQRGCELSACQHCCASQGVCTVLMHLQLPSFCSGVVVQSRIRCYSGYTALHRLRYESHHFQLIVARLLN